jgi:acyl-coenzyme A synthetase/AMP-(fatty) acid ligase
MVASSPVPASPFDHLRRQAEENPSGGFFFDRESSMTWSEGLTAATKVAAVMREIGVRPGDTVTLDLPPGLHLVFVAAIFHEAAVSSMLPPTLGAQTPFVSDWLFSRDAAESPLARRTVLVDRALMRRVEDSSPVIDQTPYPSAQSICRIVYSSGTTGHPKPVAFSVEMAEYRARAALGFWMHTTPFMSLLDVGTVSGFQSLYASMITGEPYLIPGEAEHNVDMLMRHGVASIKASPAQVAALVHELRRQPVALPSLKIIQCAGAILPAPVARAARETTGAVIHNLYGSTETGTVARRDTDSDDAYDVGTVTEESEVEIVGPDHGPVPVGSVGMVRYRRPLQATRYLNDPVATAESFRDGWFYPGDLGRLTHDGRLRLEGRASEIVNSGGTKIDPARVDAVAAEHPGVLDAAGFAHVDADGMTQFVLAVVPGDDFDAAGLVEALTEVFGTARPSVIATVTEIPRNPMGKPLRVELAGWYADRSRIPPI